MAVPAHDLSPLGPGREALGPALVHGVADLVVHGHHDGSIAGEAPHRLDVDQAVVFELAGQVIRIAGGIDQASRGTWATTKNGLGAVAKAVAVRGRACWGW